MRSVREQTRSVAWPQPVHAVLSVLSVIGGLFIWSALLGRTGAGWPDLLDAFVLSPLLNVAVAFVATVCAIGLIVGRPGAGAFAPLRSMLRVLLAVVGSVLVVAVGLAAAIGVGVALGVWVWRWNAAIAIAVLLVYGPFVAFGAYAHGLALASMTGHYARDEFRSWFGAAQVDPLLPVYAKALLAIMQVVVGTVAIAAGKGGGDGFMDWLLVLAVAGHAGMFALMVVELRQRLSGRLPLVGRTPAPGPGRPRKNLLAELWSDGGSC